MFRFILLVLMCQFSFRHTLDITIASIIAGEDIIPFHVKQSGPAIDIALEKLPTLLSPDVNVTYIRRIFPTKGGQCQRNVAAIAADLYFSHNVTVFIGPGCSNAVEIVGRMAASWNIPLISPVATNGALGVKKDFTTLTRLAYTMNKWAQMYLALFDQYQWEDFAIIHDTTYGFFTIVGSTLEMEIHRVGKRVYVQSYNSSEDYDLKEMLQKASEKSRVFLLACYGDILRKLMLHAHDLGMTNGEYAFIYARIFKGDSLGDTTWLRNDLMDTRARQAYESVMVTQPQRPHTSEFMQFEQDVKDRALRDYNYTFGDHREVNVFHTAFHDAFLLYATVLNDTLTRGGDYTDGRYMNTQIWGKRFHGISGDIVLDAKGDREMAFSLYDVDPHTGKYEVAYSYMVENGSYQFISHKPIHWPNNGGPPLNEPVCGYLGDAPECQPSGLTTEVKIAAIIGGFFVVFIIVVLIIYRKFKLEAELQSQWWKVRWRDLEAVNFCSKTSRISRMSLQSSFHNSSKKDAVPQKDLSTYKGVSVVIKRLQIDTIKLDRNMLIELKEIRDLPCSNLTRFYGLCIDDGNICILWEHCSRGSLQDVLHNDAIKLDKEFKLSLMNDIINGMCYIHGSSIMYHGGLNSSNCLIDGRYMLKITDFGLRSVRALEKYSLDANKHDLLYMPPEHIHVSSCTSTRVGSQPGDVYSFSIVLYELMTRIEPYETELEECNVTDLLGKIHTPNHPCRPKESLSDLDPSITQLLKDCWTHAPENRPSMTAVKKLTKDQFKSSAGKNILDTLLQRMEQYANNLEGLVEERTQDVLVEKKKSEELLLQILPRSVAEKLKNGQTVDSEAYESVTIYFSDIVGFTNISHDSSPMEVIDFLNDLYTCFDSIIGHFDVYKVETIGDAYMVVSGLPMRNGNEHVRQIARMSLSILESVKNFKIRHLPQTQLRARIGLHTGPVCSGVVGQKMPRYCLFGDTVNTASRMESNGEAMKIHISKSTEQCLMLFGNFDIQERGTMEIKGKGFMTTYWLQGENTLILPLPILDNFGNILYH